MKTRFPLALCFFAAAHGYATPRDPNPIERAMGSAIRIHLERNGEVTPVGSGVVVDNRGYALTCKHVLGGHRAARWDHRQSEPLRNAEVIATDANLDLALLRLADTAPADRILPVVNEESVTLAKTVFVLGAAFRYDVSVSRGIVSAVSRTIEMPGGLQYEGLIQTDAAINPGNSGGPLVSEEGNLLGLVIALREGAANIGFAVPRTVLQRFLERHLPRRAGANP